MSQKKLNIGVIFGGRSFEHEVSLVSARSIIKALDDDKYNINLFGLTKEGRWLTNKNAKKLLLNKRIKRGKGTKTPKKFNDIDVFFPILHGPFGEDGTIQGLLETIQKPYVGSGVLGSALGMDKVIQKIIWKSYNLPITDFVWFFKNDWEYKQKIYIEKIEKDIKYPCFVKPANSGSSVGINVAKNKRDLIQYVFEASRYDNKIIVERSIKNPQEVEVSVLGNKDPIASLPGEVIPRNEFYDYESKYIDNGSKEIIPARLNKKIIDHLQELSIKSYKAIECEGMARVDFLICKDNEKVFINEINTIPGFTAISMYPKLWEASGINYSQLLDKLIQLALERFRHKELLNYSYKPKKDWYNE